MWLKLLLKREKKKEATDYQQLPFFLSVGITGLEPATSRPPDVCATNCAKSRKRVQRYNVFLN